MSAPSRSASSRSFSFDAVVVGSLAGRATVIGRGLFKAVGR